MHILLGLGFALVPTFAYAATVQSILIAFTDTLRLLLPLSVVVALAIFIWGLVVFIAQSGNEEVRKEGKQRMVWGILALTLIVSVWGIVSLLMAMFGVGPIGDNTCDPTIIDTVTWNTESCV